jgi:hypothetical protein
VDEGFSEPRPTCVTVALCLIAAGLAISTLRLFSTQLLGWPAPVTDVSAVSSITAVLVVDALWAGLVAAMVYRRRWAYLVYLVVFVLGLLGFISTAQRLLDQSQATLAWSAVAELVQLSGFVLLLLPTARHWYRPAVERRSV